MVATTLLVAAFFVVAMTGSNAPTSTAMTNLDNLPMEGMVSSYKRDCIFSECLQARCDPDAAPYICLWHNGGPHGGCSPVPWSAGTCDDGCNVGACADLALPDDIISCSHMSCSPEWCETTARQAQQCGPEVPYQCTNGPGRLGCSEDPYYWVLNGCPECCNANTCDE